MTKPHWLRALAFTLSLAALPAYFAGCLGGSSSTNGSPQVNDIDNPNPPPIVPTGPGGNAPGTAAGAAPSEIFIAKLMPLNGTGVNGTAGFTVEADRFGAAIEVFGLEPNQPHLQHVHAGSRCPTQDDDRNGDGFIDAVEAAAVSGPPAIPLTTNLNIAPGNTPEQYPVAAANGQMLYINTGSVTTLNQNAASVPGVSVTPVSSVSPLPSEAPSPGVSVSPSPSAFDAGNLDQRVFLIYGVNPSRMQLPGSLQSLFGLPANETLPVACGVITKVRE